jgi:hypothetical protein
MASREFTDRDGTVWRVWDVRPTSLHPITRSEDFMGDFADGWLTFESPTERRRLPAPYPANWTSFDLPRLDALCRAAKPVSPKKNRTPSGEQLALTEDTAARVARADDERAFTSPGGRAWRVRLHECLRKDGSAEMVLRFSSGDLVVDLKDWPSDWKAYDRDGFALLLLDAEPPRRLGPGERPQRRREDRPRE